MEQHFQQSLESFELNAANTLLKNTRKALEDDLNSPGKWRSLVSEGHCFREKHDGHPLETDSVICISLKK